MNQEMRQALIAIGERYGYMDDTWPDMEDDMAVCLIDEFGIDDSETDAIIDELFKNGTPR